MIEAYSLAVQCGNGNHQVVPSLMCREDDAYLLRQLVLMWSNYKLMAMRPVS
ncbi:hypothetical protein QYF36_027201 [Acer negundo]|nr:hypothetical protein QYF36_027201 [Acer negundo]